MDSTMVTSAEILPISMPCYNYIVRWSTVARSMATGRGACPNLPQRRCPCIHSFSSIISVSDTRASHDASVQ